MLQYLAEQYLADFVAVPSVGIYYDAIADSSTLLTLVSWFVLCVCRVKSKY
jgi:hypothetical protein